MTRSGANEVRQELTALLPRLWRFALYLTRDSGRAEELVQSSCLRALEKAHQYKANTQLDRWVFSIAASVWKNSLRSESRRAEMSSVDVEGVAFNGVRLAELHTYARQVLRHVSQLPDGQRAVIALVCVEQWSYKEAARTLGVPIGTVMSRLSNARKALAPLADADSSDAASGVETR